MTSNDFHTFREYMKKEDDNLTASMEDYLEMIYRLSIGTGFTRINDLSSSLNVQPPSATKMVQKLSELKYVNYEKYSIIILEDKGYKMGEFLLKRHNIIENFLRILGVSNGILQQTEMIEHTISSETLSCIQDLLFFLKERPDIIDDLDNFRIKLNEIGPNEINN